MKKVVITGAGRGIGLALSKKFIQNGFQVIGTYRQQKTAQGLFDLAKENSKLIPIKADVTDETTFSDLKAHLEKQRHVDILINNSGVIGDKMNSVMDLNFQNFTQVLNVNTLGPIRISQLVLPFLKNEGVVAQISSQMGSIEDNDSGGYYDYRISKTALNMFSKCLSKEFTKLTCLTLHPGWVQTDMGGQGASVTPEESAAGLYEVITQATLKQTGQFFNYRGEKLQW